MEAKSDYDGLTFTQESAVMKEWNSLQQSLFHFLSMTSPVPLSSRRQAFQQHIVFITKSRARIWWEQCPRGSNATDTRLLEVCYQQIYYGILELTGGYLDSSLIPGLPQRFADLCALLLYTAEHEQFVASHLTQLPLAVAKGNSIQLTAREKDVLFGLIQGESEKEMALRLGIAVPTVHTHLRRLYTVLNVNSAGQAILRAFELRLVDWLDMPK